LWIAALTAALLPIERLVEPDRADGVLDQLALHGLAEESIAAAKIAAHWLTFAPLLLIAAVPGGLLGDGRPAARAPLVALRSARRAWPRSPSPSPR
jgi:heme exporter protein B